MASEERQEETANSPPRNENSLNRASTEMEIEIARVVAAIAAIDVPHLEQLGRGHGENNRSAGADASQS